jgi:hypothetical protein
MKALVRALDCRMTFIVVLIGMALAGGCKAADVSDVQDEPSPATPQVVTREIVPIETSIVFTDTPVATAPQTDTVDTPTPQVEENTVEAWEEYMNTEYGFSFRYPSSWTLVEQPNMISLAYSGAFTTLGIRFKRAGEDIELTQYGGAAGDFESRGAVVFLGEEIEKSALVYQEVDREIHYNGTSEITRGDLAFTLAVKSDRWRYEEAIVPEEIQALADEVVASFELIE